MLEGGHGATPQELERCGPYYNLPSAGIDTNVELMVRVADIGSLKLADHENFSCDSYRRNGIATRTPGPLVTAIMEQCGNFEYVEANRVWVFIASE
jgi:hypothetical protein